MIMVHAFTMAEKGTEYELNKERDSDEAQGMIGGDAEMHVGRVTYETGSIDSEERSLAVENVRSYGVLEDDDNDNLEI